MEPSIPVGRQPDAESRALGYALAAVAGWATVATAFKMGLSFLEPIQLLLAGTLVSTSLFALAATWQRAWRIPPRALAAAAAFGLVNPVLYYLVLFEAYDRLPAQVAQPLNYTWTIVLALLAVPVLRQPLSRRILAGVLLSYAGVLLVISRGSLSGGLALDGWGVVLALASTLLWAGYWLGNARWREGPLTLMVWSFLLALPVLAVICWLGPGWPALNVRTLGYGVWVGLLEMGLTFLLWQRALRLTRRAARIGQLVLVTPFVSLVLIAQVLGEPVHASAVAGLGVIVAGIWIARQG